TPARLASGWLARLYREGVEPSGSLQKVSDHSLILLFWIYPGAREVSWRPPESRSAEYYAVCTQPLPAISGMRQARCRPFQRISSEIETDRHGQVHMHAQQFSRRRREGLCAAQQRQRLLVERFRARRARDAAVDHAPLPVEAEEDLGNPLLATRLCCRWI